jgi:hypothetical protein
MKKLILLILPLLLSGSLYSQKYDQRLLKSYTVEELSVINSEDPSKINMLNYALDNACYITQAPSGKTIDDLQSIQLKNSGKNICFAELGLKILNQNQYLLIQGTDKMLVVKSEFVLKNELQNSTKK